MCNRAREAARDDMFRNVSGGTGLVLVSHRDLASRRVRERRQERDPCAISPINVSALSSADEKIAAFRGHVPIERDEVRF